MSHKKRFLRSWVALGLILIALGLILDGKCELKRLLAHPAVRVNMKWKAANCLINRTMNIEPYKKIDSLQLGVSTKPDCKNRFGDPSNVRTNREGVEEFHYPEFILRFDPHAGTLTECTLLPRTNAVIANVIVTWDQAFLREACEKDGAPKDVYGCIVLTEFGIAVTGIHDNDESQLAVTVFEEGAFDSLLKDSSPFEFSALN